GLVRDRWGRAHPEQDLRHRLEASRQQARRQDLRRAERPRPTRSTAMRRCHVSEAVQLAARCQATSCHSARTMRMPTLKPHRSGRAAAVALRIVAFGGGPSVGPGTAAIASDRLGADVDRWFPAQVAPKALVRTDAGEGYTNPLAAQ